LRRTTALTLVLIAHTGFAGTVRRCGVTFVLPAKWTATEEVSRDYPEETDIQCTVSLRPRGWNANKSRWTASDPPIALMIFGAGTSFDDALDGAGFEHEENGTRFGMPGGYGSFAEAEPYAAGGFSGLVVQPFSRGFIRDEATLRGDESRVFGPSFQTLVMKDSSGRIIGFHANGGTPDEPVDADAIIKRIAETLAFDHIKR
jgi:hypothetical protein